MDRRLIDDLDDEVEEAAVEAEKAHAQLEEHHRAVAKLPVSDPARVEEIEKAKFQERAAKNADQRLTRALDKEESLKKLNGTTATPQKRKSKK